MARAKYTKTTVQEIRPPWQSMLIGAGLLLLVEGALLAGWVLLAALNL